MRGKRGGLDALSQLLAQFTARLGRPPEPRDETGPTDADGDSGRAMESDIDDGCLELSHVVPVFRRGVACTHLESAQHDHEKVMKLTHENRHVKLYVRRTNRPVVAYCGLETM